MAGVVALLACTSVLAVATTAPPQPQLRGSGNASANLRPQALGSPSVTLGHSSTRTESLSHIVWSPDISYCLSSKENHIANGVRVHLWKCDYAWGGYGQGMYMDAAGRIRMQQNPDYCVVVDGDNRWAGALIQLWRCDEANRTTLWVFPWSGQISASSTRGPMCLVIEGNDAFNGARIQLGSCSGTRAQAWTNLRRLPRGRTAYAVPDEDKACAAPFLPVSRSQSACVEAAEAMRPDGGCRDWPGGRPGGPLPPWRQLVSRRDEATWPWGCYFYMAYPGVCSLHFNPSGTGGSCPRQGQLMSISVLCRLSLP